MDKYDVDTCIEILLNHVPTRNEAADILDLLEEIMFAENENESNDEFVKRLLKAKTSGELESTLDNLIPGNAREVVKLLVARINQLALVGALESNAGENYRNIQSGDDIWYADPDSNSVEHGKVFSVYMKKWPSENTIDTFIVDFDCGDCDEIAGSGLGKHYFLSEKAAWESLKTNSIIN